MASIWVPVPGSELPMIEFPGPGRPRFQRQRSAPVIRLQP